MNKNVLSGPVVLGLVLSTGLDRDTASTMTVIAWFESGWNTNSLSDTTLSKYGSRGIFQIFTGAHSPQEVLGQGGTQWTETLAAELYGPQTNVKAMHVVYKEQGLKAWSTWVQRTHHEPQWSTLLKQVSLWVPGPVTPVPIALSVSLAAVIAASHRGRFTGLVAQALTAEGLPPTREGYASWQRRRWFSGVDADGVPGIVSLTALGEKYGFKVLP